jgi:hypothetical protein
MELRNSPVYEGEFSHGEKSGYGKITCENGNIYCGQLSKNVKEGKGTFLWAKGEKYMGDFHSERRSGVKEERNICLASILTSFPSLFFAYANFILGRLWDISVDQWKHIRGGVGRGLSHRERCIYLERWRDLRGYL